MKPSLKLGGRDALDRQTARTCMAVNFGLPGFGSILAGRVAGYFQAALALAGFALTLVGGARLALWFFANWGKLNDPAADPWENLRALWLAVRWPLLGLALFGASWLWALVTSFWILRSVPKDGAGSSPPPPPSRPPTAGADAA